MIGMCVENVHRFVWQTTLIGYKAIITYWLCRSDMHHLPFPILSHHSTASPFWPQHWLHHPPIIPIANTCISCVYTRFIGIQEGNDVFPYWYLNMSVSFVYFWELKLHRFLSTFWMECVVLFCRIWILKACGTPWLRTVTSCLIPAPNPWAKFTASLSHTSRR